MTVTKVSQQEIHSDVEALYSVVTGRGNGELSLPIVYAPVPDANSRKARRQKYNDIAYRASGDGAETAVQQARDDGDARLVVTADPEEITAISPAVDSEEQPWGDTGEVIRKFVPAEGNPERTATDTSETGVSRDVLTMTELKEWFEYFSTHPSAVGPSPNIAQTRENTSLVERDILLNGVFTRGSRVAKSPTLISRKHLRAPTEHITEVLAELELAGEIVAVEVDPPRGDRHTRYGHPDVFDAGEELTSPKKLPTPQDHTVADRVETLHVRAEDLYDLIMAEAVGTRMYGKAGITYLAVTPPPAAEQEAELVRGQQGAPPNGQVHLTSGSFVASAPDVDWRALYGNHRKPDDPPMVEDPDFQRFWDGIELRTTIPNDADDDSDKLTGDIEYHGIADPKDPDFEPFYTDN